MQGGTLANAYHHLRIDKIHMATKCLNFVFVAIVFHRSDCLHYNDHMIDFMYPIDLYMKLHLFIVGMFISCDLRKMLMKCKCCMQAIFQEQI